MAEELGERTEQPTARRRSETRNRGQVAKSQDLGSAIDLFGSLLMLLFLGAPLAGSLAGIVRHLLDARTSGHGLRAQEVGGYAWWAAAQAGAAVLPLFLVAVLFSALSQFVQVGWLLTAYPLKPKLDKLSPLKGVKKIFSKRSAVKTGVNIVKLVLVAGAAAFVIRRNFHEASGLPLLEVAGAAALIGRMLLELCAWLLVLMLLMGLLDYVYQRWQHTQDMRMTKQEVKDEHRAMEGDVDTKGRRLRMARQMLLQRMQQTVPTADVIVTNPTHYSVALKYDGERMRAPRVVAKGVDEVAIRIRQIAAVHGVPIVEKPPLARALYHHVDVGREVSPQFYEAVAEVLAYVYRLAGRAA